MGIGGAGRVMKIKSGNVITIGGYLGGGGEVETAGLDRLRGNREKWQIDGR